MNVFLKFYTLFSIASIKAKGLVLKKKILNKHRSSADKYDFVQLISIRTCLKHKGNHSHYLQTGLLPLECKLQLAVIVSNQCFVHAIAKIQQTMYWE